MKISSLHRLGYTLEIERKNPYQIFRENRLLYEYFNAKFLDFVESTILFTRRNTDFCKTNTKWHVECNYKYRKG